MLHRWDWITFIHWRFRASVLQPMLPAGLTVETFDGSAWVGLTPFLMQQVRVPGLPPVPWLSRFPEINVRTYVRDERGCSGIWFFSLDASRLPAVLAARAGYALPYFWSDMEVKLANNERVKYHCQRRWPTPNKLHCHAEVEFGPPLESSEADELAHFLTARYRLFTTIAGRLATAEVEHPEWPLHHVRLLDLKQDLLPGAGLTTPNPPAAVHASTGVPVRVGLWHR